MKCNKEKVAEIKERILNFRAKYDLSQEEFARLCKVSFMTISSIENMRVTRLTDLTVAKIEYILNKEIFKND